MFRVLTRNQVVRVETEEPERRLSPANLPFPAALLVLGVILTAWLVFTIRAQADERAETHFVDLIEESNRRINQRLVDSRRALESGLALVSSGAVDEFALGASPAEGLRFDPRDPGVERLSLIRAEARDEDELDAWMEARFDAVRLEAARRSRDAGEPILTEPLASPDGAPDLARRVLLVPVFRPAAPLRTVEERRDALVAWLEIELAMDAFLRALLAHRESALDVRAYAGAEEEAGSLLYRSSWSEEDPRRERASLIAIGGRPLTLAWSRGRNFPAPERAPERWTGLGGLFISVLISGLVLNLQRMARESDLVVRRRTAQYQQSEERFRSLSMNSPLGIFHTDAAGRCLYTNPRYQEITGLGPEENLDRDWRRSVHPDDVTLVFDEWRDALRENRDFELDLRFQPPEGGLRWAHVRASQLRNGSGELIGMVGILADITERVRIERERYILDGELRETQKLESLGMLAGGVAHEFNNLLTAILGNANLARHEVPPDLDLQEYFEEIEAAAHHGADLCRQMLSYSGKGVFILQRVNPSAVVEDVLHLLRLSVGRKIQLEMRIARGLPDVEGDPGQLRQVVMNLGMNAAESIGDDGGSITVSTGLLHEGLPDGLDEGSYVYIEVSDTGKGIRPEVQPHIFDPFFSTKFTGRGLGLAVVQGIADAHRGSLTVESTVGQGATFRLLLPALDGAGTGGVPSDDRVSEAPLPG